MNIKTQVYTLYLTYPQILISGKTSYTAIMKKFIKILLTVFITIFLLLGFAVPVNMVGNWTQQFMPDLNGMPISDIFFLDSLTGWAVTNNNMPNDSGYILKTTNGGDNWIIKYKDRRDFSRIKFINQSTGFTCGGTGSGTPYFYRSTDGGNNWSAISTFGCAFWKDMSVLNKDTIWLVDDNSLCGGVFFTSTGGSSWTPQFTGGNQNPNKIYMFNARIGFMSNNSASPNIYKTENGGVSWNINLPGENFTDMFFIDSLNGWKCMPGFDGDSSVKKTTNGGLIWTKQILPTGGIILTSQITKFSFINKDTIWGAGGQVFYGGGRFRGMLYRTTNGGNNWLFQIPDTSYGIAGFGKIQFINKNIGWAYTSYSGGIHTTTGGNDTFYTGLKQISYEVPNEFKLYQNYPNPFNPRTIIKYEINSKGKSEKAKIKLIIYDITGKELVTLVNQKQTAGTYQVDFSGTGYSSGVYFYSLIVDNKIIDTKKMVLVK